MNPKKASVELTQQEILTVWVAISNYIFRMRQFVNEFETSYEAELGQYEHLKGLFNDAYERAKGQ